MTSPERRRALILLGIFALAMVLRAEYLRQLAATPYAAGLVVDEEMYDERAQRVALGDLRMGERPYYQDPLYPYLLGAVYRVFGRDLSLVRGLQAVAGAAAAAAVAAVAFDLGGPVAGAVAGLLMATNRSLLFYDAQVEKTGLTVALTALGLLLGVRAAGCCGSPRAWLLAGIPWGLLALLRGNYLGLVPPGALVAWWCSGRRPRAGLAFGFGALLMILPATARNFWVSREFVLVTSQAGQNFYIGNWPGNRSGLYVPPPFLRPHPRHEEADLARWAESETGRPLRASEVSRFYWRRGVAAIADEPAGFALATLARLGWALHPDDVPDNHDQRFMAGFVPLLGWPLPDAFVLLGLGLTGLTLAVFSGDRRTRVVGGFALLYLATLLPFFVFGRYRVPLMPALAVGGGLLAQDLARLFRARSFRRLLGRAACVGVVGLGLGALPPVPHHDDQNWNTLGSIQDRQGDHAAARRSFTAAVAANPANPLPVFNLGRLLARDGEPDAAIAAYRRAIALNPGFAEAYANLAAVFLAAARDGEAEAALRRALDLDPDLTPALINLGDLLARGGRGAEAEGLYRRALALVTPGSALDLDLRKRIFALERPAH